MNEAFEEDECLLCVPAPHPNCDKHTIVQFGDPANVPLGETIEDHLVSIPVCLAHFEAIKQYQRGKSVREVDV